jgi:hypothetical protein
LRPPTDRKAISRTSYRNGSSEITTAAGRATTIEARGHDHAGSGDVEQAARKAEQAEEHEHRDLREPRRPIVRQEDASLERDPAAAHHDTRHVDGQEATAAEIRSQPVGEESGAPGEDGVEARAG